MGFATKFTAAMLALASNAAAQGGPFSVLCDGLDAPDWGDCDVYKQQVEGDPRTYKNYYPRAIAVQPPDGVDPNSLNCILQAHAPNAEMHFDGFDISLGYSVIASNCRSTDAGGTYTNRDGSSTDGLQVTLQRNPSFDPAARKVRRSGTGSKDQRRAQVQDVVKRQQPGDNDYQLLVTQRNVGKPGTRVRVAGPVPAGSTYMIMQSDAKTTGIESSVSVEAGFFDIFSASVGLSVSEDYTVTSSSGITVNVDCNPGQDGVIYWTPLFTLYEGLYQPSGDQVNWYVPLQSSAQAYDVTCLG